MNEVVLLELANRWERDAYEPACENGSDEAKIGNAIERGKRESKRECADMLKMLISLLGRRAV